MAILASLKLVELKPPAPKAALNRRRKLIEKIDAQIQLVQGGVDASSGRGAGRKIVAFTSQRVSPWWYEKLDGKAILTVRFGGKPMELAPGKAGVECDDISGVISTLKLIRQAVVDGELDDLLAPTRRLGRLKGPKTGAPQT